ncbi:hypothetical protein SAMN02799631_03233 [Methylobacterium sp. 174MFSha1.1]|uniref:hypothetical protein n=1 Tax=Methylobacterium sp. 174MFSha1.1 TaxID=1502749 RepID=UPI0008EC7824|nr:hypothetical protein [Methylobacterium sp. 174MFSha1.1]SFU93336.1 hypothetical protein SAMN02799631_03233 [Methylobacterium sp. 174MFSha1.1]
MTVIDALIALYFGVLLIWGCDGRAHRAGAVFLLASCCVSHDQPGLRTLLCGIAMILFLAELLASDERPTKAKAKNGPGLRMSAHELMGLAEDIAKADRLRASSSHADHVRARALMGMAIDQAAGPRRGL